MKPLNEIFLLERFIPSLVSFECQSTSFFSSSLHQSNGCIDLIDRYLRTQVVKELQQIYKIFWVLAYYIYHQSKHLSLVIWKFCSDFEGCQKSSISICYKWSFHLYWKYILIHYQAHECKYFVWIRIEISEWVLYSWVLRKIWEFKWGIFLMPYYRLAL